MRSRSAVTVKDYYDRLSRVVPALNALAFSDRYAAFTMHKPLGSVRRGSVDSVTSINDRTLKVANLPQNPRIFDAGCGFGGTCFAWHAQLGGTYFGVTLSTVQCEVAVAEALRRGISDACRFEVQSYDNPLEPSRYDAVIAIESLVHSADLGASIGNLARGLAPGGKLIIVDDMAVTDYAAEQDREIDQLKSDWALHQIYSAREYRLSLAAAGLKLIHDEDLSALCPSWSKPALWATGAGLAGLRAVVPDAWGSTAVASFAGGVSLAKLYRRGLYCYRILVGEQQ